MYSLANIIEPLEPVVRIPKAFDFLLQEQARYKVMHGGRAGAKSRSIGSSLIILAMQDQHLILCVREVQKSIKDSVKRLLDNQIKRMGVEDYFHSTQTEIRCLLTGTIFIFHGLYQNIDSVKSIEGVTICWGEEAQSLSQKSLDILIPTIRTGTSLGDETEEEYQTEKDKEFLKESELWFSFNPKNEKDPVYKMFVIGPPPPSSIVREINYDQNPYFPEELRRDMEWDLKIDPDKHAHIWLGKTEKHSKKSVFFGYYKVVSDIPERPKNIAVRYGSDWGFSTDACTLIRLWADVDNKKIYITHEFYGNHVELDDIAPNFEKVHPDVKKWVIRADNSRPDTISHVKKKGFKIVSCKKGKGSIEDGVAFLKNHEIIIHKRCVKTIEEFENYSYKVDKHTEEILPDIEDSWNHCIDPIRYAVEPLMKSGLFFA